MTDIALLLIIAAVLDLAALAVVIADVRWLRRPRPRVGTYIPLKLERGPD
jgi:hypothetical protein